MKVYVYVANLPATILRVRECRTLTEADEYAAAISTGNLAAWVVQHSKHPTPAEQEAEVRRYNRACMRALLSVKSRARVFRGSVRH